MKNKVFGLIAVAAFTLAAGWGYQQRQPVSNGQITTIPIDIDSPISSKNLGEICNYSLITLPTSDSVLVGEINRIHQSGNYIYISDPSTLFQFTKQGKYIGKIYCQGSGPEEYVSISDFQIGNDQTAWILCRNTQTIYHYDLNNQFINKIKLNYWAENIFLDRNYLYVYTGNELDEKNNCQIHCINTQTGKETNAFKEIDPDKAVYLHVKDLNLFQHANNEMNFFTQPFNDTIYSINEKGYHPVYTLNLGNKNIPASFYEKGYQDIMDFFQHLNRAGNYAYGTHLFLDKADNYWISYYYKGGCYLAIINKKDLTKQLLFSQLYIDKLAGYKIDLLDLPVFVQNNSELIIPLHMLDIQDYAKVLSPHVQKDLENIFPISSMETEQNPILLIIHS